MPMASTLAIGFFTVHYNSGNHEAQKREYVVRILKDGVTA
jgi:hypothetical protein